MPPHAACDGKVGGKQPKPKPWAVNPEWQSTGVYYYGRQNKKRSAWESEANLDCPIKCSIETCVLGAGNANMLLVDSL